MTTKKLRLSLDSIFQSEFYYTDYDIGGYGHWIEIEEKDREAFLDAFAAEWRQRADNMLEDYENENDKEEG
jgi:ABC-type transporter MlaC component